MQYSVFNGIIKDRIEKSDIDRHLVGGCTCTIIW